MKSLSIILLLVAIYFVFQSFMSKYVFDTEKQVYRVVKRYYPEALMATVYTKGTNYKSVSSSGFNKLAKFIFGGNQQKESISMTAPVRMSITENGSSMSFVMPQKYTNQSLPTPNDPNIEIKKSLPEYVAVISFGGYATDEKIAIAYQKLLNILSEKKISTKGGYKLLGYNAPYQFMGRTNEVIIPIEWTE
jgi:hypothetical protein